MLRINHKASRALLCALFLTTGTLHFLAAAAFVRIVPPQLPDPALLVQISGVCELLGAIGLLIPALRSAAAYGLIALLVAVFPANIYMAIDARAFASFAPAAVLWLRLPLQVLLVVWVYSVRR